MIAPLWIITAGALTLLHAAGAPRVTPTWEPGKDTLVVGSVSAAKAAATGWKAIVADVEKRRVTAPVRPAPPATGPTTTLPQHPPPPANGPPPPPPPPGAVVRGLRGSYPAAEGRRAHAPGGVMNIATHIPPFKVTGATFVARRLETGPVGERHFQPEAGFQVFRSLADIGAVIGAYVALRAEYGEAEALYAARPLMPPPQRDARPGWAAPVIEQSVCAVIEGLNYTGCIAR